MANIPNLNTFRSVGLRGRGFRRGGRAIPENDEFTTISTAEQGRDRVVQQTDNDASSSRLSAVDMGYLNDPYATELAKPGELVVRRYPIINRGSYVRCNAIDTLVQRFLADSPGTRKQIISLGAGSDTRFFRQCDGASPVTYHEIDFEANVFSKRASMARSDLLTSRLKTLTDAGCTYRIHAIDLRDLASDEAATFPDIDWILPTLILSECCLCYLAPDVANAVVRYFTSRLTSAAGLVLYEPIRPNDAFGKTMVSNLASRGIHMQTLKRYHSLETQRLRLKLAGLSTGQGARDVYQIWESEAWVPKAEKERVEGLEWLDEIEEWKLLASHYCIAWGWHGKDFASWEKFEGSQTESERRDDEAG